MSKTAELELAKFAETDTYEEALRALVKSISNPDPPLPAFSVHDGELCYSYSYLAAMERAEALLKQRDDGTRQTVREGNTFETRMAVIEEIEKHTYRGVLAGSNIGGRLDDLITAARTSEHQCECGRKLSIGRCHICDNDE
jgi:hypothetical protein